MKTGCIYGLLDPLTYEIVYVGQTTRMGMRFSAHKNSAKYGNRSRGNIAAYICALEDMGVIDYLDYVVLEDNVPKSMLLSEEKKWIARLRKTSPLLVNNEGRSTAIKLSANDLEVIKKCKKKFGIAAMYEYSGVCSGTINSILTRQRGEQEVVIKIVRGAYLLLRSNPVKLTATQRFLKRWNSYKLKIKAA